MLNRYEDTKWVCDVKLKKGFSTNWDKFVGLAGCGDIRNMAGDLWNWASRRLQHEGGYLAGSEFDNDLSHMTIATL